MSVQRQKVIPPEFAGIPAQELGRDSASLLAQCEYIMRPNVGRPGYSVRGEMWRPGEILNTRTETDCSIRAFRLARESVAFVVCSASEGIWGLHCPRIRDKEMLERDMQETLPATWTIERETGGTFFLLKAKRTDPDFILDEYIFGGRARLVSQVPVPGSIHRQSGETFKWRKGRAVDSEIATFGPHFTAMLPRHGGVRIAGNPIIHPEFDPSRVNSFDADDGGYDFDS